MLLLGGVSVSIFRAQELTLQILQTPQGSSSFKYHQLQLHPILFIRLASSSSSSIRFFFVASVILLLPLPIFWFVSSVLSHDRTPKNAQNTTHKKEESLSGKKVFSSSAMKKALSCLEYIGDEILSSDMGIIS